NRRRAVLCVEGPAARTLPEALETIADHVLRPLDVAEPVVVVNRKARVVINRATGETGKNTFVANFQKGSS
ncbi:unnamed protein product, partial [Amoebophrya sp. A25]